MTGRPTSTSSRIATCVGIALLAASIAHGQGGGTPANEGVCDELIGLTPGLYGLCVAFCEAQDCEATFDPNTGTLTLDPSCRPSSFKLLDNYNKRMAPGDPSMPCIKAPCPCWTESELDQIGSEVTFVCNSSLLTGVDDAYTQQHEDWASVDQQSQTCSIRENWLPVPHFSRFLSISAAEVTACMVSLADECANRGF